MLCDLLKDRFNLKESAFFYLFSFYLDERSFRFERTCFFFFFLFFDFVVWVCFVGDARTIVR